MPAMTAVPQPELAVLARLVPRVTIREYCISDSSIVIGSSEAADVRDTDRSVQPRHARLSNESGRWYLEDLDSASGTSLNDQQIDKRALVVHGDKVRCGTSAVELICELVERGATTAPHGGVVYELEQLRERIEVLERERATRDMRIAALDTEADSLRAELTLVEKELVHSRELHEEAIAGLEPRLAKEHQDLMAMAELHRARVDELSAAHVSIMELRQIIDSQEASKLIAGDSTH